MKYKRYCSKCDSEIIYNSSSTRNRAKRKNSLCKSCGNSNYDIWLEKYGKTIAEEKLKKANEKRSKTCIESNRFNIHNPMYVTDIAKKSGTSKKGKKGGFFDPAVLERNPQMEMLYGRQGVYVFAVND